MKRNELLKLVNPMKPWPVVLVAQEKLKASDRRSVRVRGRSILHPGQSKLKNVAKGRIVHHEGKDPFEGLDGAFKLCEKGGWV